MKVIGTVIGIIGLLMVLTFPGGLEAGTLTATQFILAEAAGAVVLGTGAAITKRAR